MSHRQVIILGKAYQVKTCGDDELDGLMGQAQRKHQLIKIHEGCAKDQYEETIIHEALHIISGELHLDMPEETVARLAVALYSCGVRL